MIKISIGEERNRTDIVEIIMDIKNKLKIFAPKA